MDTQNVVFVKKKSGFWKAVKIILAIAAIAFVAAKIYQTFFKKETAELVEEPDEDLMLDMAEDGDAVEVAVVEEAADEAFEVPADAVIANADDMAEAVDTEEV